MKVFLKISTLVLALVLGVSSSYGQRVLGTIKPGASSTQVDVFIRPNFNTGSEYFVNLIISVGVKTSCYTTAPTATITYLGATGMTWNMGATMPVSSATTYSGYTVYTFNGSNSNETPAGLAANTEFKVATITFTSGQPSCPIYLMNNINSPFDYFYLTTNVSGAVVDETTLANNLYASPGNSSTQSDGIAGLTTNSNISLPLELLSFQAKAESEKVKLDWVTASEINTAYFEVERSSNGIDFTTIGARIKAAAKSSSALTYTAYDNSPVTGTNYYRLKMVDLDAKFKYSPIRVVKMDAQAGKVYVFPTNNTTGTVHIQLPRGYDDAVLSLANSNGQLLNQRFNTAKGLNREANLTGLAAGLYILKVVDVKGAKSESFRIVYNP